MRTKVAGRPFTEVTISYLDTEMPREQRRLQLEERYFFTCLCPPCLGEEVVGPPMLAHLAAQQHCVASALTEEVLQEEHHLLGSMLCQDCGEPVAPVEGVVCLTCGETVTTSQEEEYRVAARGVAVLLRSKQMSSGAASLYMDLLTTLFHPCNLVRVRCCEAAVTSCVLRGEVVAALVWGDQLLQAARLARGSKAHRELVGRLAVLMGEVGDWEGAEEMRAEATEPLTSHM